jgi:hypothetical protein
VSRIRWSRSVNHQTCVHSFGEESEGSPLRRRPGLPLGRPPPWLALPPGHEGHLRHSETADYCEDPPVVMAHREGASGQPEICDADPGRGHGAQAPRAATALGLRHLRGPIPRRPNAGSRQAEQHQRPACHKQQCPGLHWSSVASDVSRGPSRRILGIVRLLPRPPDRRRVLAGRGEDGRWGPAGVRAACQQRVRRPRADWPGHPSAPTTSRRASSDWRCHEQGKTLDLISQATSLRI